MKIEIRFRGKRAVDACFGGFTVPTDQPPESGGEGSAPAPFDLFLAALGTCAGFYVRAFCAQRGISDESIELTETAERDTETHLARRVEIRIRVPPSFPEKYRAGLVRAASLCLVKKQLAAAPEVDVSLESAGSVGE